MNTNNTLEEKFQTLFSALPFSAAERQSAEDFLRGSVGHEALDSFAFESLSAIIADPAIRLFRELVKNGNAISHPDYFPYCWRRGIPPAIA